MCVSYMLCRMCVFVCVICVGLGLVSCVWVFAYHMCVGLCVSHVWVFVCPVCLGVCVS